MFMSILKKEKHAEMQPVPDMFGSLDRKKSERKCPFTSANCYRHLGQHSGARLYMNNFLMTL